MKKIVAYICSLCAICLTGCNIILEEPHDGGVDPTLVQMNLTLAIDPSMDLYGRSDNSISNSDMHEVRWIIEVFKDQVNGQLVDSRIISCEQAEDGNHSITTSFLLHAAKYHVVAWMDYVDAGSLDDKYYNINTLSSISILDTENYIGDEDHKDAFVGSQMFDLSGYRSQWNANVDYSMTLERPMAKIELITTDVDTFVTNMTANHAQNTTSSGELSRAPIDLSTLQVTVNYLGYFPSSFNAYTGKPSDAQQGVSFDCSVTPLSDSEAHLAADHVFVNGTESAVNVNLVIKDQDGNVINEIDNISVPIVRGKLTVIRDDFLTSSYSPGIGIDPGFDGNINIVIPD